MGSPAFYPLITLITLIAAMLLLIGRWRFSPFPVLILCAWLLALVTGMEVHEITPLVMSGMGGMFGNVALVIIMGTLLGKILEQSGGAAMLGQRLMAMAIGRFPSIALGMAGLVISIPVYCDSGFILLNGLRQSMVDQGENPVALSTSLAGGLYASSIMVPPTPGPAAAAIILGLSPSMAILPGITLAILVTLVAVFWGKVVGNFCTNSLPLPAPSEQLPTTNRVQFPIWQAILPIVLPLVLMSLATTFKGQSHWLEAIGQPVNALLFGLLGAIPLWQRCGETFEKLLVSSIHSCAEIILIIAAGGALATVLSHSGLIQALTGILPQSLGLVLPFLIACLFKIAQGSSTVALIAAITIAESILPALGLDSEKGRLLALFSAASGAMVFAHANDSYFWVVTRFSGMNPATGYKSFTLASLWQGLAGLVTVLLLACFL